MKTIYTDLEDNQGNAALGLHAASTGGSWQSAVFGFGGLSIDHDEIPNINPWIPENWEELSYKINWRGSIIKVTVKQDKVEIFSDMDNEVKVYGNKYSIKQNQLLEVSRI
ncbi:glycosyl hydrolase family 65 protein [Caloramator sp. Dgby_cultured_2]|uniref:glycosyl hydrolase family 65 protein n=1 Tax=Caloramator sp. Dgby_cultured_2 TaxID=3029174 RepID=UPI003159638A